MNIKERPYRTHSMVRTGFPSALEGEGGGRGTERRGLKEQNLC
jgi:hypothetical protein